jgi:hypothetical protein
VVPEGRAESNDSPLGYSPRPTGVGDSADMAREMAVTRGCESQREGRKRNGRLRSRQHGAAWVLVSKLGMEKKGAPRQGALARRGRTKGVCERG